MKKISAFIIFLLLFNTNCSDMEFIDQIKIYREFTSIAKDKYLEDVKNDLYQQTKNGRVDSDFYRRINWSKSYKVNNRLNGITTYTLPLLQNKSNKFENFIIVSDEDNAYSYMITYVPDSIYVNGNIYSKSMEIYSGYVEINNSNGDLLSKLYYENGKPDFSTFESNTSKRARVECDEMYVIEWTEVSGPAGSFVTESSISTEYSCYGVDNDPETIEAGPSSTGGGGASSTGPTPIGGGESGVLEPIDIAYYLQPTDEKNSIDNPYDGMQARDKNGVIYTYDAEIGAWLLPELVNL